MRRFRCIAILLAHSALSAQHKNLVTPELLLDQTPENEGIELHSVNFSDNVSLKFVVTHDQKTSVWQIGNDNQETILSQREIFPNRANRMYLGPSLEIPGKLFTNLKDLFEESQAENLRLDGIDGWAITCTPNGFCAWQRGDAIRVTNIRKEKRPAFLQADTEEERRIDEDTDKEKGFDLELGQDVLVSLDISPDGKFLAAGVNRPEIRRWSLTDKTELSPLKLETGLQSSKTRYSGSASVVRFSPDGSKLAAGNEFGIHIWDSEYSKRVALLRGYGGRLLKLVFGGDSQTLATIAADRVLRVWPGGTSPSIAVGRTKIIPGDLSLRSDAAFIATSYPKGTIQLWDVKNHLLSASITLSGDDWIVTNPDGLFDSSENGWRGASWHLPGSNAPPLPIETFYPDYYHPGLLGDVLSQKKLPVVKVDSSQYVGIPSVSLSEITSEQPKTKPTEEATSNLSNLVRFRIEARPASFNSNVSDIAIAMNGRLLKKWPGIQQLTKGIAVREYELELPPINARITAYAFSSNGARSVEAVWERKSKETGKSYGFSVREPQDYISTSLRVLAIGISQYKSRDHNLNFAQSDAEAMGRVLKPKAVRYSLDKRDSPIVTTLVNEQATRDRILHEIQKLSRESKLTDAVIIYYAGHGITDSYHYFIAPWDARFPNDLRHVSPGMINSIRSSLISDSELEDAMQSLNVSYGAIILDSCYSGKALEGAELRGPLNLDGLARFAYEKGFSLLASSQASSPSFELAKLKSSLLAYALVEEGIKRGKADRLPPDGQIELKEWLKYAERRVPVLARKTDKIGIFVNDQRARLVLSRAPEEQRLVIAVVH